MRRRLEPVSPKAFSGESVKSSAKALGTGIAQGVFWRDMGVVNAPSGKPTMHLTGGAAKQLQKLLPAGTRAAIHLTITDDFPLAQAFVIIEALPETKEL